MQKIISKVVNFFNKVWSKEYVRAFVYIYLLVLACLSLKAARNNFTLPLTADYASENIYINNIPLYNITRVAENFKGFLRLFENFLLIRKKISQRKAQNT